MPIKYLYCLISSPKDIYYEQTFISMTSLKMHNPNAFVTLLTDKETMDSIQYRKADIKNIANEIIVEPFENSISNLKRSRILKTTMRNRIDGDFLYIDGDTIICKNLSEIENLDFDFGAVLDRHTLLSFNMFKFTIIMQLKTMLNKCDFYNYSHYFNSGLLFVKDTKFNREFFRKWNDHYIFGCKKNIVIDQPSFALTNYQSAFPVKELYGEWNVQIWNGVNYLHNAKIMHYFAWEANGYEPFSKSLPLKIKETGHLTKGDLSIIANPLGFFEKTTFIISGNSYDVCCSNIFAFLKKLHKCKFLFSLIDKIFILPRIINAKLSWRKMAK